MIYIHRVAPRAKMCQIWQQIFRQSVVDSASGLCYICIMGALRDANLGFRRALPEYGNANIWKQELLQALPGEAVSLEVSAAPSGAPCLCRRGEIGKRGRLSKPPQRGRFESVWLVLAGSSPAADTSPPFSPDITHFVSGVFPSLFS